MRDNKDKCTLMYLIYYLIILGDFEEGKIKNRRRVSAPYVYCTDVGELVRRCKEMHNVTGPCRIKIGCDSGQGFLKVTCQILDIAVNSVHFTLILAVAAVIETIHNLKVLFTPLNIELLSTGDFPNTDEVGISVDMKVCPMLYGMTGGAALFPCPLCKWKRSDGLEPPYPQDPRNMQHFIEMNRKLNDEYQGRRDKSKFCYSVETLPILHTDPHKIIKIPTVHLHLMVNEGYKELKERMSAEEKAQFEEERKAAGVIESKYEGGTLQGNDVYKFTKAVVSNKIKIPVEEFKDLFIAADDLRHTCFGNVRKDGYADAVDNYIRCWQNAGLGVGVKIHIVQHHLIPFLLMLKHDEGLGIWSEQGAESCHAAFKKVYERYISKKNGLVLAVCQYNFGRM